LKSFEAKPVANQVELKWVTASELNNDYFTVERSVDGVEFAELVRINGQGTIQSETTYQYLDEQPLIGRSYYRLKQTDFDKKFSYSKVVVVELVPGQNPKIEIYPNPVTTGNLTINLEGYNPKENIEIRLTDTIGRQISRLTETMNDSGSKKIEILSTGLAPGVYIITISRGWSKSFSRLVVR